MTKEFEHSRFLNEPSTRTTNKYLVTFSLLPFSSSTMQTSLQNSSSIEAAKTEPNRNHPQPTAKLSPKVLQCFNGACDLGAADPSSLGRSVGVHKSALNSNGNMAKKPRTAGEVSFLDNPKGLSQTLLAQNNGNGLTNNGSALQGTRRCPFACGNCNLLKNVGKSYR